MNITVVGMGHFAGVVACCLSEKGHAVCQFDHAPYLLRAGQKRAEDEPEWHPWPDSGGHDCDLVWIAYDVPLDGSGAPATAEVLFRVEKAHQYFHPELPFLISCQWPVGTMRQARAICKGRPLVYVMENVRVGHAIKDFRYQYFIAAGTDRPISDAIAQLLCQFTETLMVMSDESAELAKHATNAFMALQIAFINEIAQVAAETGASASDVSAVLRADARVSPRAPLHHGRPFGGGSLKRDVLVLEDLVNQLGLYAPILSAILPSNEAR